VEEPEKRKTEEISLEEITAISKWCKRDRPNIPKSDLAKEISKYLGWRKCSNQAQEFIISAMQQAANNDTKN
tara:strand:+ start:174 stop:389 length:216 start_codon:yes stop_codon:yes gene_type:complete